VITKRNRGSRRGWDKPGDEMVPILGDRVNAALNAYEASITQLAEEVGDSQQTISLICRSVTKKTRRTRVTSLAEVLNVPEEWLTGQMDQLPGSETWIDFRTKPAAWQLAVAQWSHRTKSAHGRDLDEIGKKAMPFEVFLRQGFALTFLIHPGIWREILLDGYCSCAEHSAPDDPDDPLTEDTQVQFANALLDILDPWIKGKYKLNYRNLMGIMGTRAEMAAQSLEAKTANWRGVGHALPADGLGRKKRTSRQGKERQTSVKHQGCNNRRRNAKFNGHQCLGP